MEARIKTFKRILRHLQRKNEGFYVSFNMGPRRKVRGGMTVNCLVQYGAKHFGSYGGYAEHKFHLSKKSIKYIS